MLITPRAVFHLLSCLIVLALVQGQPEAAANAPACNANVDVYFLIDASTSVGEENFQRELAWAADVTDQFQLAENGSWYEGDFEGARFGAMVYSRDVKNLFRLGIKHTPESLRQALVSAPYLAESSHLHTALRMVFDLDLFSPSSGGRMDAKDVLVLITDGRPSYVRGALFAAYGVKQQDITIMTASLTSDFEYMILRGLATDEEDIFHLSEDDDNATALENLKSALVQRICEVASET